MSHTEPLPARYHEGHPVRAAQAAIDAHEAEMRLEDTDSGETHLWHLVASLLSWSDAQGIDFDAVLSDVRAHFAGYAA